MPVPIPEPYPVYHEGKLQYQGHPVSVHPTFPFLPSPAHIAQPAHPLPYSVPHLPPSTYHPPEQTLLANILLARAYAPTTAADLDTLLSRYGRKCNLDSKLILPEQNAKPIFAATHPW